MDASWRASVRLQTGDDADRELALTRQRANGRGDGAGGDAGDLAEQTAAVETVGAQPRGDGQYHLPVRHGREPRVSPASASMTRKSASSVAGRGTPWASNSSS